MVSILGNLNHWTIIIKGFSSLEFRKWRRVDEETKVLLISFPIRSGLGTQSVENFLHLS